MTIIFSPVLNLADLRNSIAIHQGERRTLFNDDFLQPHLVELVSDEDYVAWSEQLLCIRYALFMNATLITVSLAICLSKMENNSPWIVRRKTIFTNIMQSLLNYAPVSEVNYVARYFDVPALDIVDEMMSYTFSATCSKSSYTRCVCVARLTINKQCVLHLCISLSKDAVVMKKQTITHLSDRSYSVFAESDIVFLIQATDKM